MAAPEQPTWLTKPLAVAESVAYALIGLVLVVMSAETLWQLVRAVTAGVDLAGDVTAQLVGALNDALFVIILLELLSTVVNHLRKGGLQLRPFLVIGIVSSVRRILVLGAQLSAGRAHSVPTRASLDELALDAGVVLVLTAALWLSRLRPRPRRPARRARGAWRPAPRQAS
jgi:uncharacterized membrane protein (DUF373 family)